MSYARNPLVAWLLSHSYGQGGAVAIPSADPSTANAPRGEFPAGIQDVLDHVCARYAGWNATIPEIDWVFLVGGPGNGKSEALRALAQALGVQLPTRVPGQPVPRVLPDTWPNAGQRLASGLEVAFVNDASIPRSDAVGTTSLFRDVQGSLSRLLDQCQPVALFANVNRGILVEEANALASFSQAVPRDDLAKSVIQWLAAPPSSLSVVAGNGARTTVPVNPLAPQYGQFHIQLPSGTSITNIVVHVVFLDTLSLLEPAPRVAGHAVNFAVTPPGVAPYRTLGMLLSTDAPRDATTAGKLVAQFTTDARWAGGACRSGPAGALCDAHAICPFAQNARWLQDDALRNRYLDTLRAAEIAAGRRFTYRDMLGHVSLTILGQPEEKWLGHAHPCDWAAEQNRALQAGDKSATVSLLSHRIYSNLFTVTASESGSRRLERERVGSTLFGALKARAERTGESPRLQAFERAFHDIDPARDTDPWDGVRTRVLDAVESLDVRFPSDELAGWAELPEAANSGIEAALDQVLREELATEHESGSRAAANRARFLRRWRAIQLSRHVGLALGRVTNGDAIQAWLAEHENALRSGNRMPLGDGIYHLVLPRGIGGRAFLAPLRPRTYSITNDLPPNTLLVPLGLSDLSLVIVPHGDTMLAEVQASRTRERLAPSVLASLVVDLAVAREAMLHADGNMRPFTEIGYTAFARIERARASLVSRQRSRAIPVHFTDEKEQLFKLVPNAAGPAPLRAQRA
jgi:hypothetical protein